VLLADMTARRAVISSRLPVGSLSAAMRRVARPRGPIGRQIYGAGPPQVVDRLNLPAGQAPGALTAAGPVTAPRGMVALDDVSPGIQLAKMTPAIIRVAGGWMTLAGPAGGGPIQAAPSSSEVAPAGGGGIAGAGRVLIDWNTDPDVPDFFKGSPAHLPSPFVFPSDAAALARTQESFRAAASSIGGYLNTPAPQFPDPPPLIGSASLAPARAQLRAQLDPEETIAARLRARIALGTGVDPLQPLRAGPGFPQAMYAALADLSADWMLPGISNVPMNVAALLETNPRFVEAFLVGLNEELARELLWREVPLDVKATYFRTFWGARTGAGSPAPDIPSIDTFDGQGHLGDHTADHATGGDLVLLIRAVLFRRYPNAVVSAIPAVWNGVTRRLGAPRQLPIFRGDIGADVTFFGFDVDDPRGSDDPAAGRPGWYFVIEEHATEPHFGLEPETSAASSATWNDLRWNDAPLQHGFLNPAAAPATPKREGVTWGQSAAAMAFILIRRPVRVALHGRALIPEGGA
jgi:hypothetical protein